MLSLAVFGPILVLAIIAWKDFRFEHPDRRLQLRITDLWALALGLSPGMYLCSIAKTPEDYLLSTGVLAGELLGGFYLHLRNEASRDESSKREGFGAAVNVFVGALLGTLIPFLGCFLVLIAIKFMISGVSDEGGARMRERARQFRQRRKAARQQGAMPAPTDEEAKSK